MTSVGILIISLTVYSCIALWYCILKQKKHNAQMAEAKAQKIKEENDKISIDNPDLFEE